MSEAKLLVVGLALVAAATVALARGYGSQIGSEKAIPVHHADGQEFEIPLEALIAYGQRLFVARFTSQDGADRFAMPAEQQRPKIGLAYRPTAGVTLRNQTIFDGLGQIETHTHAAISVEMILKQYLSSPPVAGHRFCTRIGPGTLKSVLDRLLVLDGRYTWSIYRNDINVYPKAALAAGAKYFLNRRLEHFEVTSASDPSQLAFKTVADLPGPLEQIAVIHSGPALEFPKPWTATFTDLSVRDMLDEIANHICSRCGWTLSGANNFRTLRFHSEIAETRPREGCGRRKLTPGC